MKTLLILVILSVLTPIMTTPLPAPQKAIAVEVTYGARKGCFGSGPCRIEKLKNQPTVVSEGSGWGNLWFSREGKLVLRLEKCSMTPATEKEQFGNNHFHVPKNFALATDLLTYHPVNKSSYTILPGNYPVINGKDHFTIIF